MDMTNINPAPLVLIPGTPQWFAVMEAMDQFCQNHGEYAELLADDEDDKAAKAKATQEAAEEVMEHFTKVFCDLADR